MSDKKTPNGTREPRPYPGLRFYEADRADYFAGRHDEAVECTGKLVNARLLILHGRSGCGKSSFLRAGVKPMLEETIPGSEFTLGASGLEVVRCTEDPLREFSKKIFEICTLVSTPKTASTWALRDGVTPEQLDSFKASFIDDQESIGSSARKLLKLMTKLTDILSKAPVFVVDQAEEIFTLVEKDMRENAKENDVERQAKTKERLERTERRANEFFRLLAMFAEKGARSARIVISLRTEYKGQLDDQLATQRRGTDMIEGFYLPSLEIEGLTEAIKRPTLDKSEWDAAELAQAGDDFIAPYNEFGFKFQDGVAEKLAKSLMESLDVPVGGILPTMQIACLRLHEYAKQAQKRAGEKFMISERQLSRIGKIELQIHEYITEKLEDVCLEDEEEWQDGVSSAVESWHRILANILVEEQADGRAVSGTETLEKLIQSAAEFFPNDADKVEKVSRVIGRLTEPDVGLLLKVSSDKVALGHDSVALSLNKWKTRFNTDDTMMRRMNMGTGKASDELTMDDLFPPDDPDYRPHKEKILLHRDMHWDRQYPHFAAKNSFAERLGILFEGDDVRFDAADLKSSKAPKDWGELTDRLLEEGTKRWEKNDWVMVAADYHSFPWTYDTSERKLSHKARKDRLAGWSDILVTDLFVGNGLIGMPFTKENRLEDAKGWDISPRGAKYEKVIKETLEHVVKEEGVIKCHDALSKLFLLRACDMMFRKRTKAHDYFQVAKNVSVAKTQELSASGEGLVDWLLSGEEEGETRFIVGTAAARALALQAGAEVHFATSHLTIVARAKINAYIATIDDAESDKEELKAQREMQKIAARIQEVIKHTTWQLSMPPTRWKQGRNRALVLRLASIGYFTSEYIRSNGDEFVRFIRDHLNAKFAEAQKGEGTMRGLRINRNAIREAVKDCYSIMRFDECGPEFYDPDSTTAYFTQHSTWNSKSVASEVYAELSHLRMRTISNYDTLSRIVEWMETQKAYDLGDADVQRAIVLKRCAWNNFRIFNFYDSARMMADASLILQKKMEAVNV